MKYVFETWISVPRIAMAMAMLAPWTCLGAVSAGELELDGYSCYEVKLVDELVSEKEIGWARSGAWGKIEGQETLLLVDARRAEGDGQVLAISTTGVIRPGFGTATGVGFKNGSGAALVPLAPNHIHSDGHQGIIILDDKAFPDPEDDKYRTGGILHLNERLQWLGASPIQGPRRPIKAAGGAQDIREIKAIFDMVAVADGLLVFADYIGVDGEWHSGFVHRSKAGDQLVYEVTSILVGLQYAREMPYLAAVNKESGEGDDVAFILFMDERPSLGKVSYKAGSVEAFEILSDFPQQFRSRPRLVPQPNMPLPQRIALYYRTMEKSRLAAGLFSWAGELYLLGKEAAERDGKTAWYLLRLDQDTGSEVSRVRLPTDAAHLTVIPGDYWALVQMGSAQEGFGPRDVLYMKTDSMVLVPGPWLEDLFAGELDSAARAHCRGQ